MNTKALAKQDIDRLYNVCSPKSLSTTVESIARLLREQIALSSFSELQVAFKQGRFIKLFEKDLFENVLAELNISETQWTRITSLSQKWASICDSSFMAHFVAQPLVQSLASDICHIIDCKIQSYPKWQNNLWDFDLAFSDIHLNYFDETVHMIVVTDSRAGPNEFIQIKELIRQNKATNKVTLLLLVGDGTRLRDLAKAASIEIVVLDENDWKSIIMSNNSRQMFCHRVARRVSVQALQPYQTQGKVRTRMFYGRHDEMKRIKNNLSSSFALYGGRLIGKSSFLDQIAKELETEWPGSYQICSITAQGFESRVEVCRAILKELGIPTATHRSILTFERLMRNKLATTARRILILIDEVDDLIQTDEQKDSQLFEVFHNLNNDYGEYCRFVFAGYRDLARHCMDSKSRFRNFAEPILLGNLDLLNAHLLIREPLCDELGFTFESNELVDKILEMTGCHPNYIQVFCKNLSEYLDQRRARRITESDIDYAFHDPNFRARVTETFYVNFSPLQRIIVALVILDDKDSFSLPEVAEYLLDFGLEVSINDLHVELRQLEMSFVIEKRETKYQFIHKLFPDMLKKSEDLDGLAYLELRKLGL